MSQPASDPNDPEAWKDVPLPDEFYIPALPVEFQIDKDDGKFEALKQDEPLVQCEPYLSALAAEDSNFAKLLMGNEVLQELFVELKTLWDNPDLKTELSEGMEEIRYALFAVIEDAMRRRLEFAIGQKKRLLYWAPVMKEREITHCLYMVNLELSRALKYVEQWHDIGGVLLEPLFYDGIYEISYVPKGLSYSDDLMKEFEDYIGSISDSESSTEEDDEEMDETTARLLEGSGGEIDPDSLATDRMTRSGGAKAQEKPVK